MRIVGLTGGIASGKSTFSGELAQQGLFVIDCDALAKDVSRKGGPAYKNIVKAFSEGILDPETGEIDR
jgi:dephospho-CoA kinase